LKNGAAALMRKAIETGSGSGACARQGRGVRRRSAPFRSCSSLGFGLLEENRRAVQRFARLCYKRPFLGILIAACRSELGPFRKSGTVEMFPRAYPGMGRC